jgi:hypothetical protein
LEIREIGDQQTTSLAAKTMRTEPFENFPWWMVAVCNAVGLTIYAIGLYLTARLGIVWVALYAAYCAWIEWRVLSGSCRSCYYYGKRCGFGRSCYYYGKRCGFGKGRLCSWLLAKDAERSFGMRQISWRDVAPDFLVSLLPLAVGVVILVLSFSWFVLCLMVLLVMLGSVGTAFVRGQLACKYCKQRELGCPAERLFGKTKHT